MPRQCRRWIWLLGAVGTVAAWVSCYPAGATADTVKLGGTGSTEAILAQLGKMFTTQTGIAVKLLPNLGSSGGLRALADGVIDIAASGRPLNADETRKGLAVAFSGHTPFVIVTSNRNPGGVTSEGLANIVSSVSPKWPDGAPIRVILRPRSDTDTVLMGKLFPGMADAIETARRRPDITIAGADDDNADLAEETPGSLTAATYLQVVAEKRRLQFVPIDGVAPTLENYENLQYGYGKELHIVVRLAMSGPSERFVAFLHSTEAKKFMRDVGLIPVGND